LRGGHLESDARKPVGVDSRASSLPILVSNFGCLHRHSGVDSNSASQRHYHQGDGHSLCPLPWMVVINLCGQLLETYLPRLDVRWQPSPGKECYQCASRCRLCSHHTRDFGHAPVLSLFLSQLDPGSSTALRNAAAQPFCRVTARYHPQIKVVTTSSWKQENKATLPNHLVQHADQGFRRSLIIVPQQALQFTVVNYGHP